MKDKELSNLIKQIETSKKEEYNIDFSLSTPTIIEYYEDKIKNNNYKLVDKIKIIKEGYRCDGLVSYKTKKVVVFDKNYKMKHLITHPIQFIKGDLTNKVIIALTTLHEIRHIIQHQKPNLFSDYERFCFYLLRIPHEKYHFDKKHHDSLYYEIDANLYALNEVDKYISLNEKQNNSVKDRINKVLYQKNTYDFDFFLDYFNKNRVDWGLQRDPNLVNRYWNTDGSFKRPRDIVNNSSFCLDNYLTHKIFGSNAYVSFALSSDFTQEELAFLDYQIMLNKDYIEKNIEVNNDLYDKGKIDRDDYEKANKYFELLLLKKDIYQELLMKKQDSIINNTTRQKNK